MIFLPQTLVLKTLMGRACRKPYKLEQHSHKASHVRPSAAVLRCQTLNTSQLQRIAYRPTAIMTHRSTRPSFFPASEEFANLDTLIIYDSRPQQCLSCLVRVGWVGRVAEGGWLCFTDLPVVFAGPHYKNTDCQDDAQATAAERPMIM